MNTFLLLQEPVLHELVDQREHHGVGGGLDREALARGEGDEHAGHKQEEENGRCQKIPHFVLTHRFFNY
jgi:hypothetical protein